MENCKSTEVRERLHTLGTVSSHTFIYINTCRYFSFFCSFVIVYKTRQTPLNPLLLYIHNAILTSHVVLSPSYGNKM